MSKEYSKLERKLAFFLKKFPGIKSKIKVLYQVFQYNLHKKKDSSYCNYDIKAVDYKGQETFFGYYDKSPLNSNQTKILFNSSSNPTKKKPSHKNNIDIILKDFVTDEVLFHDQTSTYNWQQGCKLQWLDDDNFIYNFYDEESKKLKSKKVNSNTFSTVVFDYPLYDTFGSYALGLNYRRLAKMRPDYGYQNYDERFEKMDDSVDGVFLFDTNNGDYKKLFSINEVKAIKFEDDFYKATHKLNHIIINPTGSSFVFLHRWFVDGVKTDRLVLSSVDGSKLDVLLDDGMISHYFWKDSKNLVAYARTKDLGDRYYCINTESFEVKNIDFKTNGVYGDGHPNIFDEKLMLIDTYPNKARNKSLFMVNLDSGATEKIGEFLESLSFRGETRCDLHPRWSPKGDYVFIDSVHELNKRKLYSIKIK